MVVCLRHGGTDGKFNTKGYWNHPYKARSFEGACSDFFQHMLLQLEVPICIPPESAQLSIS